MKRVLFAAFVLISSLPAWGEELPPAIPPQPETIVTPRIPSPSEQAPVAVLPAASETDREGTVDAPFRERPYRIWPFYYHRHFEQEHERSIYGPFWLSEQDHGTTFNYPLWPIAGVTRTEGKLEKLDLIWPFTGYEQKERHTSFDLLWPVTGYTRDDGPELEGSSLFLVRPLVGYFHETSRAPGDGEVTGEEVGYPPFYYSSEKGGETFRYVFPTFLSRSAPDKGTRLHTFLPLYFYAGGPEGSTLFVLPSYLRIRNPGRQLYSLLPFFHSDENNNRSTRFILPSYFRTSSGTDESLTVLAPLYLAGNSENGTSYRYYFPTWFEQHREKSDLTWFLPFFTANDDATGGSMIRTRTVLWPIYYHRSDEGAGIATTSVLLSLYYRRTNSSATERYTTILWPLLSFGESPQYRLVRVWPYAYERRTEDNNRTHYFLWPLIGFGSGDRESTAQVLPVFYRHSTPDQSVTVLLPLYLQRHTPEKRYSFLLPLYANYAAGDRELSVTLVPPMAWGESGERRYTILFPVWYRGVYRDDTENVLLNIWWSRNGERRSSAFFPLYYHSTDPERSQTQFLTFWRESGEERSSFAFFPLYFRYETPTETGNLLLNTWWNGGERLERFVFFPLAWYRSPAPEEQEFIFFPLFSYDHKGEESSTFSFLWRVYYQHQDQDGSVAAFFWWIYRSEERPGFRRVMCWPYIDYERNTGDTDEVFTSILLRFLTYERNGERTRLRLFGLTLYES